MIERSKNLALAVATSVLVSACSSSAGSATPARSEPATTASFIDKVWRVSESPAVASGTLYVFLSEGTLVITSGRSKPALGTWKYEGGILTMVEESIAYRVDILNLTADQFRIRSNNPGGAVEITMVPADAARPPGSSPN